MSSPEEQLASMVANLAEKTGKSLEQWVQLAKKSGAKKHGEIVTWLKSEHGMGHGYANLVAQQTLEAAAAQAGLAASAGDLVAAQYAGAKAALKPIHDTLVAAAKKLGPDVEIAPKKTSVSLRRSKQFALIEPATNTRVDLGLQLKGVPIGGRLEKYPSTMCTHRVRIENAAQIDAELLGWLAKAYTAA